MSDLFGTEVEVLAKALDFRAFRNNLIAANLANADTPGYKAVSVEFEEVLKQMVGSDSSAGIRTTHPKHLPPGGGEQGEPEIVTRMETDRRDGNSVDMDEEVVNLTANQLVYNANVEALSRIFRLLEYSISEGGK